MKSLPGDVLIDILTRLPVKSILRFKSVSKHWSALPTTPQFVAAHLRRSSADNPLLIVHHGFTLGNLKLSVYDAELATTLHPDLKFPVESFNEFSPSVVGSCNGLVCIEFDTTGFVLWNPAMRQHAWLPVVDLRSPFRSRETRFVAICESFGFGFSGRVEDYKVIWENLEVKAVVFSWKSWSWNELRDARIPAASYGHQVAANGHLYWLGTGKGKKDFVIAFDLASDSFWTIDLPDHLPHTPPTSVASDIDTRMAVFRSCLTRHQTLYDGDELDVVVIGENGEDMKGTTLWEFICRHGWFDGKNEAEHYYRGHWNGVQVMRRRGRNMDDLYLFNPESGAIRRFDDLMVRVYDVCSFVHSLVPVRGTNIIVEP
ncbi:unnamed protein product [Linum tenue]|uniref:F-box domain-containing protein n=1 Tax=Linum tenue TaxID=586396 RepID=A0AAV0Q8S8_9ROSI|nr:unnamed protein product [Linum tenue]CAI0541776.1 unnamed protein product [Linum tenue]